MAITRADMPDGSTRSRAALKEAVIISMLGGPGSGKGTQCQMLSQKFDLAHISIGDVLRQEVNRPGSQYADMIRENMIAGRLGPTKIIVSILRDHMLRSLAQGTHGFILDGFPRDKERYDYFVESIGPITLLIVLDCPESTMIDRLTLSDRNRFDDNTDSIRKRIETFQKTTCEVIDDFRGRNKLHTVNSDQEPGAVALQVDAILDGVVKKRTEPVPA